MPGLCLEMPLKINGQANGRANAGASSRSQLHRSIWTRMHLESTLPRLPRATCPEGRSGEHRALINKRSLSGARIERVPAGSGKMEKWWDGAFT
jgi:hypothetical protein